MSDVDLLLELERLVNLRALLKKDPSLVHKSALEDINLLTQVNIDSLSIRIRRVVSALKSKDE